MHLISILSAFLLACIAGCLAVRRVTPAFQGVVMAATGAIGSIVLVAALITTAETTGKIAKYLGLASIILAAMAMAGGFAIIGRMLAMVRRRERP